jgi:hypothetical protein
MKVRYVDKTNFPENYFSGNKRTQEEDIWKYIIISLEKKHCNKKLR